MTLAVVASVGFAPRYRWSIKVLVTGAAGFIGFHLVEALCSRGDEVMGLDNFDAYYDPSLKEARIQRLSVHPNFELMRADIRDPVDIGLAFDWKPERVVHLAAQAGVRYSLTNPRAYVDTNVSGTLNILEACRNNPVEHLVFASSSSVYGANTSMPFSVHDRADHPLSLYAATKKSTELLAHSYSHLFRTPTTGLRFFTVYGPWGRPDMAYFSFVRSIIAGDPIELFNDGQMHRDFTYVADIVEGIVRVLDRPAAPSAVWNAQDPDPASSSAPYRLYNIGNSAPVELLSFVRLIEAALGKKAIIRMMPMQPGDVVGTYAALEELIDDTGYQPTTSVAEGVAQFVEWYLDYYRK